MPFYFLVPWTKEQSLSMNLESCLLMLNSLWKSTWSLTNSTSSCSKIILSFFDATKRGSEIPNNSWSIWGLTASLACLVWRFWAKNLIERAMALVPTNCSLEERTICRCELQSRGRCCSLNSVTNYFNTVLFAMSLFFLSVHLRENI